MPRIKICGVTSLGDARLVADARADALGLIYGASVRQVGEGVAAEVVREFQDQLWCVGVFRHQSDRDIVRIVERDGLRHVQLHDEASVELLGVLASLNVGVIRALSSREPHLSRAEHDALDAVILDGAQPGSGVENDWELTRSLRFDVPVLIAGGLHPDNVARVIGATSPWGVDVASGVELSHGVKDPAKVASFVSRARAALAQKGPQ